MSSRNNASIPRLLAEIVHFSCFFKVLRRNGIGGMCLKGLFLIFVRQ